MNKLKAFWPTALNSIWENLISWMKIKFLARESLWLAVELNLIVFWALWVGRDFLNFDPGVWPAGGEFPMVTQSHYIWTLLRECGTCIFWNGFQNGGAPAFVELHGAPLNPIVIITTLAAGVINGAKLTLLISLIIAGWAQWWIARSLDLGRIPRLWSSFLVIVAGHLAGKLENGGVTLVLSTALASLVIAASLQLALDGKRRTAIILGIVLALTITAGQGYLQIGLILAVFPALVIFLFDESLKLTPAWKEFAIAGVIGFLLVGYFAIPTMHFWPNFSKALDPTFDSAQAMALIPVTWFVDDPDVFRAANITPQPWAYLYLNYIGWIPILFSILAIRYVPRSKLRILGFFILALLLILTAGSGHSLVLLANIFKDFSDGIRNPPLIVGLSVPLLLGLSAWGLDFAIKANWPILSWNTESGERVNLRITWLVLTIPLLWSINSALGLSQIWLQTYTPPEEVAEYVEFINLSSTQWIEPPYGQHYWLPELLEGGYKLSNVVRPWNWKGNSNPGGYLKSIRDFDMEGNIYHVGTVGNVSLIWEPKNEYAVIRSGAGSESCQAYARGGHIDVYCQTENPGNLIVWEHNLSGWHAKIDGQRVPIRNGPWLTVAAPAGEHHYQFRYLPWDVLVGLLLTVIGVVLSIWLWNRTGETTAPHQNSSQVTDNG